MLRILFYFLIVTLGTLGFSWLADRPGKVKLEWQGEKYSTDLMMVIIGFMVAVGVIMLIWWLIKTLIISPGRVSRHMKVKKREQGLDAVSRGLIAVSSGDAGLARRLASKADRKLHSDALSTLLKAQAAQLAGERNTARRLYEAMLENPETEVAGLRGLYLEARREKQHEAAQQFAEKAVQRNPSLTWSTQALMEIQSRSGQWAEALKTLDLARKHKKIDKNTAGRQRAVLLTAQAIELEETDMDKASGLALEAHKLAPDLVPATNVAARILASQGNVGKASKIIEKTWDYAPHPDLALTYAHARPGDSPRDRLSRIQKLAERSPHNMEGPIAVAEAAIEGQNWDIARNALKPLADKRPSERVCTLMARIEAGEFGDKGRVREWLARAVRAPRDPSWTADGYISKYWAPISPITGQLDAFEWKVPAEQLQHSEEELPFDEFIPLKAEQNVPQEADDSAALATAPAIATAAPAIPGDDAKPVETTPVASQAVAEPQMGKVETAEIINETPPVKPAAAEKKTAEPELDKDQEPAAGATSAQANDKADKVETETGKSATASLSAKNKPTEDRPTEDDKPITVATKVKKRTALKEEPDIYIPPRLPDDPGPLSNKEARPKSQRLPQRYRQST